MRKYNRLIMFCDYGIDDAVATLHILAREEMFSAIDIVPIGGNVDASAAYRNAHTLLAAARADKSKVRIVDTRMKTQRSADIPLIHGGDGMGDLFPPAESEIPVVPFEAFKAELEREKAPDADCVLSLGPCTLPVALGYVPFCTVAMGGTVNEPPNYGDHEFNEAMDVSAFKEFSFTATAVATLDTCHARAFSFESFGFADPLCRSLFDRYAELCRARNAKETVYDYVAALAVTDPELFDAERIRRKDGVEFNNLIYKGESKFTL